MRAQTPRTWPAAKSRSQCRGPSRACAWQAPQASGARTPLLGGAHPCSPHQRRCCTRCSSHRQSRGELSQPRQKPHREAAVLGSGCSAPAVPPREPAPGVLAAAPRGRPEPCPRRRCTPRCPSGPPCTRPRTGSGSTPSPSRRRRPRSRAPCRLACMLRGLRPAAGPRCCRGTCLSADAPRIRWPQWVQTTVLLRMMWHLLLAQDQWRPPARASCQSAPVPVAGAPAAHR
mmetsp:Transcript_64940/g.209137  ORF Transcript_64940/g.209137 Transcript_64940/m.209137 type:complete len:230 (+) Transcript_64940:287-976(+)